MINTGKLAGRTIFITGASRGIGKAIALKVAKDGANVVIAAKTATPHPKLPGTIYTAAKEIEEAGGKALPCIVDVRDEQQVKSAVEAAVEKFGGIDVLVNNASAISLTGTLQTDMKRYDLMHGINTRGTFLVSKICLPYLKKSKNPHILNLSPPLLMQQHWFENHVAYTMAKYGMSMCVLGMAGEFKSDGVAVNALWPYTAIHTAAIEMLTGPESAQYARKPDIIADAAYAIMIRDSRSCTGNFFMDEDVVKSEGITDLTQYAIEPKNADNLSLDFFIPAKYEDIAKTHMAKKVAEMIKVGKEGAAGGGGGVERIQGMFNAIKNNLSTELVQQTQAVYFFRVKGADASTWYVDLKNGSGGAGAGEPPSPPDVTLTMDSKDMFDLFAGKLKATNAFISGKLKIEGNLQKATRLEKLLTQLKSKM